VVDTVVGASKDKLEALIAKYNWASCFHW
jgi:hypothetical protein